MAYCCECGKKIKGNVGRSEYNIVCSDCIQKKVNFIRMLERETGIEVHNGHYFVMAYKAWQEKQRRDLHRELRRLKGRMGLSLPSLAGILGVSKSHCSKMLSGQRPLNEKALKFIDEISGDLSEDFLATPSQVKHLKSKT